MQTESKRNAGSNYRGKRVAGFLPQLIAGLQWGPPLPRTYDEWFQDLPIFLQLSIPAAATGGRVQASSLHSSFLQKQHADDSIWSCSNRRHKLVWEGEEKKGGVQEQGEKEGGGGEEEE